MGNLAFDKNITWLGLRTDVSSLLRKSQIGVLSSLSEGFPVTLLEYGCAKLGVVSTAVGQCAEMLDHGKAGFLVPPGDAVALADALIKLLTDISTREYLGRCLFEHVSDNYSQDFVLDRLFNVYAKLIRNISLDAL